MARETQLSRDVIARETLQTILRHNPYSMGNVRLDEFARVAYGFADAMVRASCREIELNPTTRDEIVAQLDKEATDGKDTG